MRMTNKEVVQDLQVLMDSFLEQNDAFPICLEKAIEIIGGNDEQRWIPCSERLPEEGEEVLACIKDWQTGNITMLVTRRFDYNSWAGYGRVNDKLVAWMPLPEPYKTDMRGETE